jgi:hypothetical protein
MSKRELSTPEIMQAIRESSTFKSGEKMAHHDFMEMFSRAKTHAPRGKLDQAKWRLCQDGEMVKVSEGVYTKAPRSSYWLRRAWV